MPSPGGRGYWDPEPEDRVCDRLAKKIASVSLLSEGDVLALAAESRSTGAVVADVVLHWVSEKHGLAEIGYAVHPDHVGRGYAASGARAVDGSIALVSCLGS